jgi:cell division septation protein DedD
MDTPVPLPGLPVNSPKARQFSRSPVLFASIQLANLNGFIVNASEGGLCVQTAREIPAEDQVQLRFQSMRPHGWVETRARIAWRNENKTVAGMQFLDSTPELVAEIRHWLSFGASLQELRGNWWPDATAAETPPPEKVAVAEEPAAPAEASAPAGGPVHAVMESDAQSSLLSPSPDPPQLSGGLHTATQLNRRRVVAIAGIFVLVGLALLTWREGSGRRSDMDATKEPTVLTGAPEAKPIAHSGPADTSAQAQNAGERAVKASSATVSGTAADAASLPPGNLGGVLQVAAMAEESNANNLAESLQAKKFPAFVSKKDGDRFYRVLVGPYSVLSELRAAKKALESDGFESIEKNWSR